LFCGIPNAAKQSKPFNSYDEVRTVKKTRVAVYGRSLSMAGIAASLRAAPALEVITLDPDVLTALQQINEFIATVIVFDRDAVPSDLVISLLREQPGLQLIGVDPSSNQLLVLSSHPAQALSVAELIEVINRSSQK
jgi:hypothetical protein